MAILHDPRYKAEIEGRIRALRPDSQRRWGRMSVAQMLWHVNEALEGAVGRVVVAQEKVPLPRPLMKFIVMNLPWPKGAPTLKRWVPQADDYDFVAERERLLRLLSDLSAKPMESAWPASPILGHMSGKDVSRLQAKHLNHHLTQFGV